MRDHDPVLGTAHPRRVGLREHPDQTEVQASPPPPTLSRVIAWAAPPADPAPTPGAASDPDVSHEHPTVLIEIDLLNDGLLDPQQDSPYPGVAHAVLRS
jgi:hypothetical protein